MIRYHGRMAQPSMPSQTVALSFRTMSGIRWSMSLNEYTSEQRAVNYSLKPELGNPRQVALLIGITWIILGASHDN